MTFGSLFAGIGGMDLGLERAGMFCRWQVEIDPFARRVLAKHWPSVIQYKDVRNVGSVEPVDLICGGFPCQDIASANRKGRGILGKRSGLWSEFARLIGSVRPAYVLIENVDALLSAGRGFGTVLRDLAALGYDAEWDVFPAAAFGAPHRRNRLFVVAYPCRQSTAQAPPVLRPFGSERGTWDNAGGRTWRGKPRFDRTLSASDLLGMDDGVPRWMDRNRTLGNAIVPDVAEHIGRLILAHASTTRLAA